MPPGAAQAWEALRKAMRQPGVYLLLEDTTELSWSGKQAIAGLGPIGNSAVGLQGFFVEGVPKVLILY